MVSIRRTAFALLIGLNAACGSNLEGTTDAELQEKMFECSKPGLSPGMAIQCDNYRRECSRRREQGRFVC